MSKKIVILIGPPGSGKGTQAELLAEKLDLFYFESSKIIEAKIKQAKKKDCIVVAGRKYYLLKEKLLFEQGILNTPAVVTFWIKQEIEKSANQEKSLVLAGSPRTMYEGKKIIPFLKKLYGLKNIQVVLIKLSHKESIRRNTKRRICSSCRHPIPNFKRTKDLTNCPKCGGVLVDRGDLDRKEIIKTRLKEYRKRTRPLLNYFKEEGLKIEKIEGEKSIEEAHKDILKAIEQ